MDNLPNTFLALIKKYEIEIPMIQRDYAQGRDDDKTCEIREHFINEIISHIEGISDENAEPLELDFIYGPIKDETFIPVDGQQRLTTLFLLHWYLAKKAIILNEMLKKFTYKVRTSTQDFLKALLDPDKGGTLELVNSPKAEILDASWYYSMWNYDPSIQGMLNTLDTIHDKSAKYDKNKLWRNLKDENPIQFNLLNMEEYNLSEELYLKMNARGLELTPFENFKAWLQGYCDENDKKTGEKKYRDENYFNDLKDPNKLCLHWTHKIDKKWTDLFWDLSDKNSGKIDKMFMHFFNSMAQIAIINNSIKQSENNSTTENEEKLEKIKKFHDAIKNNSYISFNDYDGCFTKEYLIEIFTYLDILCDNENLLNLVIDFNGEDKKGNFLERFVNNHSYDDIVNFYAVFKYVTNNKFETFNDDKTLHLNFKRWIRIIRNLVENTTVDNANIIDAIKTIDTLLEGCESKNILKYLKCSSNINISTFTEPIKEEIFKANLILNDKNWEELIIEAENHGFFRGQIGFLLKNKSNHSDKLNYIDDIELDQFQKRHKNAIKIFDASGVSDEYKNDALLLRAYIYQIQSYSRDPWAKLFGIKYDLEKNTWKALLGNDEQLLPLIELLDISNGNLKSEIEGFLEKDSHWRDSNDVDVIKYKVHEDLYKSKLLTKIEPDCILHGWDCSTLSGCKYILYPYNAKASWKMYVIGTVRNDLLASLLESEIIKLKWNVKLDGISYFHDRDIIFIYEEREFTWTENDDIIYDGKSYNLKKKITDDDITRDIICYDDDDDITRDIICYDDDDDDDDITRDIICYDDDDCDKLTEDKFIDFLKGII
jgi:uncharacterized protein DUF262